jgi:hypothetical protein
MTIDDHPVLNTEELLEGIKTVFGDEIAEELLRGLNPIFNFRNREFFLSLNGNLSGIMFTIELLKEIPDKKSWPKEIFDWLKCGGFLEVENPELYAGILEEVGLQKDLIIVSLEQKIKYPIKAKNGLIHQKELGLHFLTLKEGLKEAFAMHANVIAIADIPLKNSGESGIKALSRLCPILLLSQLQQRK